MKKEPKNIEELRHSAILAENTVSSTVSFIDHKLSQILALHQNTAQSPRFPPDETALYQNRPFVEEYQTYKQPQYPQFNSRIPQNRNIGQRNYHEIRIYRDHKIITDKIATDFRKGHVSSHQFVCFVTMKGMPEIYVRLKIKHVIIAKKFAIFQGLVLMAKDHNRDTVRAHHWLCQR